MSQTPQSAPPATSNADRFLGRRISPLTRRRLHNFRANRRGYWSLWIFLAILVVTLFAEAVANDKPFLIYFDGGFYTPIFKEEEVPGFHMAAGHEGMGVTLAPITGLLVTEAITGQEPSLPLKPMALSRFYPEMRGKNG